MSLPYIIDGELVYPEHYSYQTTPKTVYCNVNGKRRLGHVMKVNAYTVWVKIMSGARTSFTIKRHIMKHNVKWRQN